MPKRNESQDAGRGCGNEEREGNRQQRDRENGTPSDTTRSTATRAAAEVDNTNRVALARERLLLLRAYYNYNVARERSLRSSVSMPDIANALFENATGEINNFATAQMPYYAARAYASAPVIMVTAQSRVRGSGENSSQRNPRFRHVSFSPFLSENMVPMRVSYPPHPEAVPVPVNLADREEREDIRRGIRGVLKSIQKANNFIRRRRRFRLVLRHNLMQVLIDMEERLESVRNKILPLIQRL